jgi:hypothetical protein
VSEYDYSDEQWDEDEGFAVNMSGREAASEARELTVLAAGFYHVAVDECDLEESKSEKNFGKPMFNFKLKIQDGDAEGRNLYCRAMLWDGALYTISQAMKAVGLRVAEGEGLKIPPAGWWLGKHMLAQVKVVNKQEKAGDGSEKYVDSIDENGKKIKTNDVGGFKTIPADWDPKKGKGSVGVATSPQAKAKAAVDALAP